MIIDCILNRKDGSEYNARDFYNDMVEYGGSGIAISRAMDGGTEADVKKALCDYIDGNQYNPAIKDYINSVSWLAPVGYEDVDKGLQTVRDYLTSIENVWNETRTLKLYDAFFKVSDILDEYPLVKENDGDDIFYDFCQISYDDFTEWMEEEHIKDERKYIGRTSSFYLTDIHDKSMSAVIENLLASIYGGYYAIDIDDDCKMIHFTDTEYFTEAEQIENEQEYMEYIANGDFLKDVQEYMKDAVKIAEYIDGFKENQVEYIREYISNRNDLYTADAEAEQEEEETFTETYRTAIQSITEAIEGIINGTGCSIAEARRIVYKSLETVTA